MTSSRPQAGRWQGVLAGIGVGMWVLCAFNSTAHAASLGSPSFNPSVTNPVGWRGDRTGRYLGATPPTEWHGSTAGPSTNIGWVTQLPLYHGGSGASAPIVVGDKIYFQVGSLQAGPGPIDLYCVNAVDGEIQWISPVTTYDAASAAHKALASSAGVDALLATLATQTAELVTTLNDGTLNLDDWQNNINGQRHNTGAQITAIMQSIDATMYAYHDRHDWGYAASTPTSDGQHIYTYFSSRTATCFDLNGNIVWSTTYPLAIRNTQEHGSHASPMLLPDRVIAIYGTLLMAFSKSTGDLLWEAEYDDVWGICYSSPVMAQLSDGIAVMAPHGQGFNAANGSLLWGKYDNYVGENTSPVSLDGILYGFERSGTRSFTIPTSIAGGGGLVLGPEKRQANQYDEYQIASVLAHNGFVYGMNDLGLLHVLSMAAGDEAYTQQILSGAHGWVGDPGLCPSPAIAGGYVYAMENSGTMVVFAQGDTYQEIARNKMDYDDSFVVSPVYKGSRIFLRGQRALYCIDGGQASDSDGDGLSDILEIQIGTNPNSADTDGDGMTDPWEHANGLDPLVNDSAADADSDGLFNIDEFTAGTDPNDDDSDNDGMLDGWEYDSGLNPLLNDAGNDPDGDGMTNVQEFIADSDPLVADPDTDSDGLNDPMEVILGTNPALSDTDADGMPDGWEYGIGLDPLVDDSGSDLDLDGSNNGDEYAAGTDPTDSDSDDDGLADGAESAAGTNPLDADSDNDGMTDGWENNAGLNPLVDDGAEDPDGDGRPNVSEFLDGTNPLVADAASSSTSDGISCGAPSDAAQAMVLAAFLIAALGLTMKRTSAEGICR